MITKGTIVEMVFLIVMVVAIFFYIRKTEKSGELPNVRYMSALEGIEEGIGRAIETGGKVHFAPGSSGGKLASTYLAMTMSGLNVLSHVAHLTARKGADLVVSCPETIESITLMTEAVHDAYLAEGKPNEFSRDMLRYYGHERGAYCQGVSGMLVREKVACNILMGAWHTDCLVILAVGRDIGAINVGGTPRWNMMYAFAMFADYLFIGEELYAASALVSGDRNMICSLAAEDIGKWISIGMLLIFAVIWLFSPNTALSILAL